MSLMNWSTLLTGFIDDQCFEADKPKIAVNVGDKIHTLN